MKIKKNHKGASVVGVLVILLLVAAVAVVVWLVLHGVLGLGKGSGKAEGEGKAAESTQVTESTESADESNAEAAAAQFTEVEVAVKGDKYSCNGNEYTLDELMAELESVSDPAVTITDDGGLAETLDALIAKLNEKGISYTDKTADVSAETE